MSISLIKPFNGEYPITQTYDEHVRRAIAMGCCFRPGPNCSCYYYGGIDWGTPNGTPIKAAASGIVDEMHYDETGYGTHVRIRHEEGYLTIYGHLGDIYVKFGDPVYAGEVIGHSGNTGNSTGPHLHFELRDPEGVPIDPAPFLNGGTPVPPPAYAVWQVLVDALRIRSGPGTSYPIVGQLNKGATVAVIDIVRYDSSNYWCKFGPDSWSAALYRGQQYMVEIEEIE